MKYFLDYVNDQAKAYKTNDIVMTMGDDFNYVDASNWFQNLDDLIR